MKNKRENNKNVFSPIKNLKTIDECPETDDIIKKIENLNFSSDEKSFDTPFFSLSKIKNKKNSQSNKSISILDLINDNSIEDFPFELKTIRDEERNDFNYISNILINNKTIEKSEENNSRIYNLLLKEKINRICMLIQNYNINQKCVDKMNNFIYFIKEPNNNILYKPIDYALDVILELLSKIKEDYKIKDELINKLNGITLNKENYEKKILEIKKELIYKEKEIEILKNKKKSNNINQKEIKDNSQQRFLSELNNMNIENKFLFNTIQSYKTQFKNICYEYNNLYDKYKICLKTIDNKEKKDKIYFIKENLFSFTLNMKSSNNVINNNSLNKINDNSSYNNSTIKKIANTLISLLIDINKMLFKYDFALVKMNKNSNFKTPLNDIKDLNPNIDINYLLNEHNCRIFSKYFLCNMDIVYNKIINSYKGNNNSNSNKKIKKFKAMINDKKKINRKTVSLNNSRTNQSINIYVPKNNCYMTNFKSYISIKKHKYKEKSKNITRNSTSRNGFNFLNFYCDTDLDAKFIIKKDINNYKINKKFSHTINIDKYKNCKNNIKEIK